MSISSIFSNSATDPLSQLYAPAPAASTTGVTSTQDPDGDGSSASSVSSAATSTSVSNGAKLLKQLQDLQKNDPAEFKKVTADIVAQLQASAQQVGGSQGAALTSLASKFSQASQTGDLTALQSGHHHGGHHHASSASGATSAAVAAYQSDPLTSTQSASAGANLRSQVSSIISQVLTTDLGSATPTTTAGTSV